MSSRAMRSFDDEIYNECHPIVSLQPSNYSPLSEFTVTCLQGFDHLRQSTCQIVAQFR